MKLSHFAVYQKLTQYCKSTILQLKKKKKSKFTADKLILASYHSSLSKYFMWDLAAKYKVQLLWRKSQDFFQICSLWDWLLLQYFTNIPWALLCASTDLSSGGSAVGAGVTVAPCQLPNTFPRLPRTLTSAKRLGSLLTRCISSPTCGRLSRFVASAQRQQGQFNKMLGI